MRFRKYFYLSAVVFSFFMFSHVPCHAEGPGNDSSLEKNKKEILGDIELFERNINETRSCVSQARSADEMRKCSIDETRMKFQRVQDDLTEIGMTPEERRMYELKPQR